MKITHVLILSSIGSFARFTFSRLLLLLEAREWL